MAPRLKCVRNIENLSTAIYKTRQKGVANAGACVCAVVCVCGPCVRENLLHFSDGNCNRMCFTFIITKWIMTAWTGASLPRTHTHITHTQHTHNTDTQTLCAGVATKGSEQKMCEKCGKCDAGKGCWRLLHVFDGCLSLACVCVHVCMRVCLCMCATWVTFPTTLSRHRLKRFLRQLNSLPSLWNWFALPPLPLLPLSPLLTLTCTTECRWCPWTKAAASPNPVAWVALNRTADRLSSRAQPKPDVRVLQEKKRVERRKLIFLLATKSLSRRRGWGRGATTNWSCQAR